MKLEFHDIEQNSEEWFAMRAPRLTSSNMAKIMANDGKQFGDPAKRLSIDIALAQITGECSGPSYSNAHMERGHEEEPLAVAAYEEQEFVDTSNGGFWCDEFVGCSPDRMVGNGVLEVKSAIPSVHAERIRTGKIDSAYRWQCVSNLLYTGSEWLDFVSYCSAFPLGKRLFICRLCCDEIIQDVEKMTKRIELFRKLVEEQKKLILNGRYVVRR